MPLLSAATAVSGPQANRVAEAFVRSDMVVDLDPLAEPLTLSEDAPTFIKRDKMSEQRGLI